MNAKLSEQFDWWPQVIVGGYYRYSRHGLQVKGKEIGRDHRIHQLLLRAAEESMWGDAASWVGASPVGQEVVERNKRTGWP